jgi:Zn ribbon nucleic-acid-binding protein
VGDLRRSEGNDPDAVECPACGADICMTDPQVDGYLREGYEQECTECGHTVVVESVDYEVTVTVHVKEDPG